MEREGGLVVRGRVEIDMRQPFRSVKEAISLFGEKVLAGEIYATNKLKETKLKVDHQQEKQVITQVARNENAETNESSCKKTNEEGNMMAFYLNSLKHELEETKKELQKLKTRDKNSDHQEQNPEIEEIKFVEDSTTTRSLVELKTQTEDQQPQEFGLEKKRSVKFASPPLLTRMMIDSKDEEDEEEEEEEEKGVDFQSPSIEKKKRRKPLIPLFGGLFSKKKGVQKSKSKSYRE